MLKCPRDRDILKNIKIRNTGVKKCVTCDGIWLPYQSVKKLYDNGRITAPSKFYSDYKPDFEYDCWESNIRCPHDNYLLTTYKFKSIHIDICHECKGLWLDKGEMNNLGLTDPWFLEFLFGTPDFLGSIFDF